MTRISWRNEKTECCLSSVSRGAWEEAKKRLAAVFRAVFLPLLSALPPLAASCLPLPPPPSFPNMAGSAAGLRGVRFSIKGILGRDTSTRSSVAASAADQRLDTSNVNDDRDISTTSPAATGVVPFAELCCSVQLVARVLATSPAAPCVPTSLLPAALARRISTPFDKRVFSCDSLMFLSCKALYAC